MNDAQARKFDTLTRVDNFCLKEHAADFPADTFAGDLARSLHEIVAALSEHAGAQAAARRLAEASTDRKEAARDALRASLERISDTARGMEATLPGVRAQFRLPTRRDDALAAAARAYIANGASLKSEFAKRELPPDFFTQLQAQLDDFEKTRAEQDTHTDSRIASAATVRDLLARGLRAVRELDPVVRNKYRADPAALAAWRSASHTERAPKTKASSPKKQSDGNKPAGAPTA